jgi:hypothetical protein
VECCSVARGDAEEAAGMGGWDEEVVHNLRITNYDLQSEMGNV